MDFADWKTEFQIYITSSEEELERQINFRTLGALLTAAQEAALAATRLTEHLKLRELFNCLGSEGFRRSE